MIHGLHLGEARRLMFAVARVAGAPPGAQEVLVPLRLGLVGGDAVRRPQVPLAPQRGELALESRPILQPGDKVRLDLRSDAGAGHTDGAAAVLECHLFLKKNNI